MASAAAPLPGVLNVALSNYAKEYTNNALIGDLLAPRVPVDRQSFQYLIFDRSSQRLDRRTLRAPGGKPETIRWAFSTDKYFCDSHALDAETPREVQAYLQGMGFDAKMKSARTLIDKIQLSREAELAALMADSSTFANTVPLSGSSCWDNSNSKPIEVVDAYKALIRQAGVTPTHLFLSDPVAVAIKNHPEVVDRFKYTNGQGVIGFDQLSTLFGVKVVPASAIQLDATNTPSWTWGTMAILAHIEPVSSQQDLSPVKTFSWTSAPDTVEGYGVLEWPDPHLSTKKDWGSVDWYYDLKATAVETVVVFNGCVAAPVMGAIPAALEG